MAHDVSSFNEVIRCNVRQEICWRRGLPHAQPCSAMCSHAQPRSAKRQPGSGLSNPTLQQSVPHRTVPCAPFLRVQSSLTSFSHLAGVADGDTGDRLLQPTITPTWSGTCTVTPHPNSTQTGGALCFRSWFLCPWCRHFEASFKRRCQQSVPRSTHADLALCSRCNHASMSKQSHSRLSLDQPSSVCPAS